MGNQLLDAALGYAKKGWRVFPCKHDKKPYTQHGCKDATLDDGQIKIWWEKYPDAMIGVATGNTSGIWALDVDVPKKPGVADGRETLKELIAQHGELPYTFKQVTPSGGEHYIFSIPDCGEIKNSVRAIGGGLDVRGTGGYIVMAPSQNDKGGYVVVNDAVPCNAPDWLLECVFKKKSGSNSSGDSGKTANVTLHPYVRKALETSMAEVANAEPGTRNNTLFTNVAAMAGFIPTGYLGEEYLHEQAAIAYQKCSSDDFAQNFESTFRSAVERGSQTPRQIPDKLPSGFRLVKSGDGAGLWYEHLVDREKVKSIQVGAPLFVRGLIRDEESDNWGKLLEWNDPDGHKHLHPFPAELLASSDSSAWRGLLAKGGYTIAGGRKTQELLTQYVCGCQPEKRFIGVDRTGWHSGSFVLPDKTYPENQSKNIILVNQLLHNPYESAGTLKEWRDNVGKLAAGNSRLIFALCVAFASPLLHLLGMESG